MPTLPIFEWPAEILTKVAEPISREELQRAGEPLAILADSMLETMYYASGVGLAAPQVGVSRRLFVMDCGDRGTGRYVFINPIIRGATGKQVCDEGCLSFPGIFEKVTRAEEVMVEYLDLNGESHRVVFNGFEAICVQHEIEHLDGTVFVSHLSRLKRDRALQRLIKSRRKIHS